MRNMLRRFSVTVPVLGLLLVLPFQPFSASTVYKKIRVFVLVPPELVLPGVKQIAVLDFSGEYDVSWASGTKFTDYLISRLLEPDRGIHDVTHKSILFITTQKREGETLQKGAFTNVFEVAERSRLYAVMSEQRLQASDLFDDSRAVQFGRMLGVQAIVLGTLSYTYNDRAWTGTEKKKAPNGQVYEQQVPCVTRTVTASYRARVVNTESGLILGSNEASNPADGTACGSGAVYAVESIGSLFNTALEDLAPQLADYLTPHFELQEFELEKITTRQFRDVADDAAELAENLDVDRAYVLYWSIYEEDPYNDRLLYNLGLLNEVVGNYADARKFYGMAYQLKDEKRYREGLGRVERNVAFAQALSQIGIEIAEHTFQTSRAIISAARATEVEIKGRREDRIAVYAEASEGSKVLAEVPGGVTFDLVREQGEWVCIRLLGGEEAWIKRDKVKVKD